MVSPKQWNTTAIKQHKQETGQAVFSDEHTLVSFNHDFGNLINSTPSAVSVPKTLPELQSLIGFANQHGLPITIRGMGLSQGGQALSLPGGLILSMHYFNKTLDFEGDTIWVEANTSWSDVLNLTIKRGKAPYVLPYNCNLSVGGVLSAGGVGASSFKYGAINAHVTDLEIVDATGTIQRINKRSPLFHACLSGQGRFAVITKARISLRPVLSHVKTFFLVYTCQEQWFEDWELLKERADYLELFCSPSIQGGKLVGDKRIPMAEWLYGLHVSFEYDDALADAMIQDLKPWQVAHVQDEPSGSYFLRHNSRFDMMKMLGQWELTHPWYECFVPTAVLRENLKQILGQLPLHYANLVHVVPIKKIGAQFLMFPQDESFCSFMILNPGVPECLKDSCLKTITLLDAYFISNGGKRYLSGYLGEGVSTDYWIQHFGDHYGSWMDLKKRYDPRGVFRSILHQA